MKKALVLSLVIVMSITVFGGSLEPSSGPGSTMKTLDEVEPRIPISQADIPKTINTSGSYYLTENVTTAGTAISVTSSNVTIDLMGHTIDGPDTPITYGIEISSFYDNIEIRNGMIKDFDTGIQQSSSFNNNISVINIVTFSNLQRGIYLKGTDNLVKNCTANDNGTAAALFTIIHGIRTGDNSIVKDCITSGNGDSALSSSVYGIEVGVNSSVTGCMSHTNGKNATSYAYGIRVDAGSSVTSNTVYNNGRSLSQPVEGSVRCYGIYTSGGCTITDNTAYSNGSFAMGNAYGIYAGVGSTVVNNTSYYNGYSSDFDVYGIYASSGSTVISNTVYTNGTFAGDDVNGIFAGTGSTLTGNTVNDNGDFATGSVYGIYLAGNSLVDQNTAYDNGTGAGSSTNMDACATCTFGTNHAP